MSFGRDTVKLEIHVTAYSTFTGERTTEVINIDVPAFDRDLADTVFMFRAVDWNTRKMLRMGTVANQMLDAPLLRIVPPPEAHAKD